MNRKQFFKKLGIGAAVILATPSVLEAVKDEKPALQRKVKVFYKDEELKFVDNVKLNINEVDYFLPLASTKFKPF